MFAATAAALILAAQAQAHAPGCNTPRCDRHAGELYARHHPFTGYAVAGRVSTFGLGTGDSQGQTADGGNTSRPCIAVRSRATLGRRFLVTVLGHRAVLIQCDWGPAASTGREIDITGDGDLALGLSPLGFPTDSWGTARMLR